MDAFSKAQKTGKFASGANALLAKIPTLRRTPSKAPGSSKPAAEGGVGLEELLVFSNVRGSLLVDTGTPPCIRGCAVVQSLTAVTVCCGVVGLHPACTHL